MHPIGPIAALLPLAIPSSLPLQEWVLQMAREVACGMQYLHAKNIIHGDLVRGPGPDVARGDKVI